MRPVHANQHYTPPLLDLHNYSVSCVRASVHTRRVRVSVCVYGFEKLRMRYVAPPPGSQTLPPSSRAAGLGGGGGGGGGRAALL